MDEKAVGDGQREFFRADDGERDGGKLLRFGLAEISAQEGGGGEEELAAHPLSGSLLSVALDVAGLPEPRFAD